jgi:hypothetical protein
MRVLKVWLVGSMRDPRFDVERPLWVGFCRSENAKAAAQQFFMPASGSCAIPDF